MTGKFRFLGGIDLGDRGRRKRPGAEPMKKEWVVSSGNQWAGVRASLLFKQWGGREENRLGGDAAGRKDL